MEIKVALLTRSRAAVLKKLQTLRSSSQSTGRAMKDLTFHHCNVDKEQNNQSKEFNYSFIF